MVEDILTKRSILGRVAAVFDPLGLASPFIVRAKILIQDSWSMGLGWDEPITREISVRVKEWFLELEELKEIKVPRSLREPKVEKSTSVHTFVDASKDAYEAVSYLRCEYDQGCNGVSIIASKTKVAPLKPMTTPRLELMEAILGLSLTTSIVRALNIPIADAHFWSDSMDVLYWIRGRGRQFRPVVRFITNCRARQEDRIVGPLTPEEIQNIEVQIIRDAQRTDFAEEFSVIQRNRVLPKKSRLLKLTPKVDLDGLPRCDERLQYAKNLPYDLRFPIILPRGNWVTKLIVKHYHEAGHHVTGTNHTLAIFSSKYWIVAAREEIRDWETSCNECRRRKLKAAEQIMAPPPDVRLRQPLRAFAHVSVDYGGPFITVQGRGKRRQNAACAYLPVYQVEHCI